MPSLTPNSNTFDSSETMKVRLRWVSMTPLGLPVVPEVNSSDATASGPCLVNSDFARSCSTSSSGSSKAF